MVSSANLMMLFLFWQVLSYMLYLLAHNHAHAATLEGAFRTFTLLRVGDVAFLSGIVLAYQLYGTLEFQPLFAKATELPIHTHAFVWHRDRRDDGGDAAPVHRAMSKSAQFPIHIWLPRSLYAQRRFMRAPRRDHQCGRLPDQPLGSALWLSSTTLHVAFVVGMVTAVLGATMMLCRTTSRRRSASRRSARWVT